MMSRDGDYNHFVCIVAGDDPNKLMGEYDNNKTVEPYIIYKYDDANKIKVSTINYYNELKKIATDTSEIEYLINSILDLKEMSDDEFFETLCEDNPDYYFNDNGDIMSTKNPDGHFSYCNIGKLFSIPFLTMDGREVYQARKNEIDWDKVHLAGGDVYRRVWEMVMENSAPNDEHENVLFENMKDKIEYFNKFLTKENYVASNTAFWGYAFVSDMTGWMEINETDNQFTWITNFYDIFIKNLPEDTLLSIYECKK